MEMVSFSLLAIVVLVGGGLVVAGLISAIVFAARRKSLGGLLAGLAVLGGGGLAVFLLLGLVLFDAKSERQHARQVTVAVQAGDRGSVEFDYSDHMSTPLSANNGVFEVEGDDVYNAHEEAVSSSSGAAQAPFMSVGFVALLLFAAAVVAVVVLGLLLRMRSGNGKAVGALVGVLTVGAVFVVGLVMLGLFWVVESTTPLQLETSTAASAGEWTSSSLQPSDSVAHDRAVGDGMPPFVQSEPSSSDKEPAAEKEQPDTAESTLPAENPAADQRPAWVRMPVDEPNRRTVSSGWHVSRVEARRALFTTLQDTLNSRMNELTADETAADRIGLTEEEVEAFFRNQKPQEHEETTQRVGDMQPLDQFDETLRPVTLYQKHLLVAFPPEFEQQTEQRYAAYQHLQEEHRQYRQVKGMLVTLLGSLAALLTTIGLVWGLLKLSSRSS